MTIGKPDAVAVARPFDRENLAFIALLGALSLVPLAMTPWLFYYDVTPKVVVALLAGALGCLWLGIGGPGLSEAAGDRPLLLAVGGYAGVLLLCTIISTSSYLSFGGGLWRRFGLVSRLAVLIAASALFLLIRSRPQRWEWCLRAFCVAGTIAAFYGVSQYFGFDPFINSASYRDSYWNTLRPPSTLGHATYFATFSVQVAFWGVGLATAATRRSDRVIGYLAAVSCSFALLLTGTRAGVVGAFVGILVLLFARESITWRTWLPFAAATAAAVILTLSPAGMLLRQRLAEWATDTGGGPRLLLWRDSLSMGFARPLIGFGLETFTEQFPGFESAQLAAAYPEHHHESPHNVLLDAFVEQGIPGVVALVALIAACLWQGMQALRQRRQPSIFMFASLAAAIVAQMFTAFTLTTYLMLMVNLALIVALAPHVAGEAATGRAGSSRWVWIAAGIALVGLSVRYAERDAQLATVDTLLKDGSINEAIDEYRDIDRSSILGESPDLWFSRRLLTSVRPSESQAIQNRAWQESLNSASRATESSEERFTAQFQLAVIWALADSAAKTEESLRAAIAWAPQWYKPHWYLSRVLAATGRKDEAAKEAAVAKTLAGGHPLE